MTVLTKIGTKTYEEFVKYLTEHVTLVSVELQELQLAKVANALIQSANLVSLYKTRSNPSELSESLVSVLALQTPMICFPANTSTTDEPKYEVFGGVMTYQRLMINHPSKLQKIPVLVLPEVPPEKFIRLFCLQDFTRMFLHDAHNTELKTVQGYLDGWFKKTNGALSIFQSEEWLTLYPQLNSKAKVAKWLNVSNKALTSSDD